MPIFNDIGKKISQTTQNALKGTKDFADIARLNAQISDEQKLMDSYFAQIGKKYYELFRDSQDENFASFCASITESAAKISGLKNEIVKIKGVKKCPGCGAEIPMSTTFCGICGSDTRIEPAADASASFDASRRVCPNCNKEVAENMAFCTDCGQKL